MQVWRRAGERDGGAGAGAFRRRFTQRAADKPESAPRGETKSHHGGTETRRRIGTTGKSTSTPASEALAGDPSACATRGGSGRGDYGVADVCGVGELCGDARDEAGNGGCG